MEPPSGGLPVCSCPYDSKNAANRRHSAHELYPKAAKRQDSELCPNKTHWGSWYLSPISSFRAGSGSSSRSISGTPSNAISISLPSLSFEDGPLRLRYYASL